MSGDVPWPQRHRGKESDRAAAQRALYATSIARDGRESYGASIRSIFSVVELEVFTHVPFEALFSNCIAYTLFFKSRTVSFLKGILTALLGCH